MNVMLHINFPPCIKTFLFEQVVLPEGSKDIDISVPFPTKQEQEVTSCWMIHTHTHICSEQLADPVLLL